MSASHDRKFFVARFIAGQTSDVHRQADPVYQQEVLARIQPVGRVAVAGQDNSALAPAASSEPAAAVADLPGDTVYNQACVACHGAGIAGAPKFGDAAAWAPRIAQGLDTLHTHAIQGFQGKAGYMPPKGGRTDLSDQSVINAVDYIVAGSK